MRRVAALLASFAPAALAGGLFLAAFGAVQSPGKPVLGALLVGALCGVVVAGLLRLFRVAPFGYPVAGLFCGPVPFLLLSARSVQGSDERAAVWLVSALFGLLVGALEWARVRRALP